ncbi:MAG: HEAT repeat domain-containing protein [Gemmatimonadaceae bacterium]|nr:HEAT repeat domain-containing protein [Gemmatimonadaceae bacterium]
MMTPHPSLQIPGRAVARRLTTVVSIAALGGLSALTPVVLTAQVVVSGAATAASAASAASAARALAAAARAARSASAPSVAAARALAHADYRLAMDAGGLSASVAGLSRLREFTALTSLSSLATLATLADLDEDAVILPSRARTPWSNDQVSDSLYRQARERMNRGDYRKAADLFMEVAKRAGKAPLAGDALYWNAYSLYRDGASGSLNEALSALDRLNEEFPSAATLGDASTLRIRVCGELAKRGDEQCAAQVAESAGAGESRGGSRMTTVRAPRPPRPPMPPSARRSASSQEPGCPDEDDDERIAALNALLQMDADRALPILEKVLARRDKCSVSLRRKAVFLVSQKGDARAADILMGAVRNDPDGEVREQAVFWLGQTRDERAVEMLQEILQKESNDEVLQKAVFALSQHRSQRASTILRDLAQRDGAALKVREQAIFWLGQQRDGANADLLRSLYGRVKEEELKEKIIFSISQTRATDNNRWLLDLAMNGKEPMEMRKKALFWAGQSRATSMDDLAALYNKADDREMKEQIIFVYSQRRDAAAVDKLMEIARSDKDKELRKKAIFWLSQSRDPRAAKFLEDLIG